MRDRDTPLRLVRKWEQMIPGVYGALDTLRAAKSTCEIRWPDYCDLPIGAAFTLLVAREGLPAEDAAAVAAELTACYIWRRTKVVYSFDPDLAAALAAQAEDLEDADVLPCEALMRLPYPCVYLKAPGLVEDTDGFWAWIEYDMSREAPELRVQWVLADMGHSVPQVLHLLPGKTIRDCALDTARTTQEHMDLDIPIQELGAADVRMVLTAIQLILYLSAENAEAEPVPPPLERARPRGKVAELRRSQGDKASQVQEYSVGIRVGAALRKARAGAHAGGTGGSGGTKRPHTRRGHWHHYWTGPRDGDRALVLKWTAPTIIHPEAGAEDAVVIYPVRGEGGDKGC